MVLQVPNVRLRETGAPETIRTSDLCLRRATLYPAELRAPVRRNRRNLRQRQRPTTLQKSPTFCVFYRFGPFLPPANLIGLIPTAHGAQQERTSWQTSRLPRSTWPTHWPINIH